MSDSRVELLILETRPRRMIAGDGASVSRKRWDYVRFLSTAKKRRKGKSLIALIDCLLKGLHVYRFPQAAELCALGTFHLAAAKFEAAYPLAVGLVELGAIDRGQNREHLPVRCARYRYRSVPSMH